MARGDPINRGALTAWISSAQERGLSQRGALRELRESGLGVRDTVLRQTWNEVRSARANAGALADLGGNQQVPGELHTEWAAGQREGYIYNVSVLTRDEDGVITSMPFSATSEDPMLVDDIMAQIEEDLEAGFEAGSGQGQELHGIVLTGAYRMTGAPK